MSCKDGVIPKMDLGAWRTASPQFVIPEALLEDSVSRAKREAEDYLVQEEFLLTGGKSIPILFLRYFSLLWLLLLLLLLILALCEG